LNSASDDEPQLTLEAVSEEATLLIERRKSFGPNGGTIGRAATSDWVLADEFVSRQHARITYSGGRFFIEDTNSTGGVSLNDRRLVSGQPHPLAVNDRLFIKPYAIEVLAASSTVPVRDPRALSPANVGHPSSGRKPAPPLQAPSGDPLKTHLPMPSAAQKPQSSHDLDQWEIEPLLESLLEESAGVPVTRLPPAPTRETSVDIQPARPADPFKAQAGGSRERPVITQPPVPSRPVPAVPPKDVTPSSGIDLERLLASAGLDATQVTPEVAQQIGEVLRVVVDGLLDVLRVRQQAREAFRIQGTMFRPRGNNPLKYSTDVEDALHNLFVKRGAGYLGPVEAFEDAFNDLRHHQLAVMVGMKTAFRAVLERFEASGLQKQFDESGKGRNKGRLGLLQGTPNPWAAYGEWVDGLLKDPDGSFRDLFGEVFSEAYEQELKRLRAALRPSEPRKKE
jgi:type VI secretion system FHA domain protein